MKVAYEAQALMGRYPNAAANSDVGEAAQELHCIGPLAWALTGTRSSGLWIMR